MKHRILWLIPLLCFFAVDVHSQSIAQTSVGVSATVREADIEIITMQSMDLIGATPVNNIVIVDPVLSGRAGKMMANGSPNSFYRFNYDVVRELTNVSGTGVIYIEYAVSGNILDEQETSELFEGEGREIQFGEDGSYYFWIGGRIDLSQATPGSYEGEFTIEIEYQ